MHLKMSSTKWPPFCLGLLQCTNAVCHFDDSSSWIHNRTIRAITSQKLQLESNSIMMTSSNRNIFCVTGLLCGKFTSRRWIPRAKAGDVELMFSMICAGINVWVNSGETGDLRHHRAHYDVRVMIAPSGQRRQIAFTIQNDSPRGFETPTYL